MDTCGRRAIGDGPALYVVAGAAAKFPTAIEPPPGRESGSLNSGHTAEADQDRLAYGVAESGLHPAPISFCIGYQSFAPEMVAYIILSLV